MGAITDYLAADHVRLGGLLARAQAGGETIDLQAYAEFRSGLLRHIAMEERVLLPAARAANRGQPIAGADQLKRDHAALAALLVPSPRPDLLATIRQVLEEHNRVEEGPGGVYCRCEALLADAAPEVADRLQALPAPRVAPHYDTPLAFQHLETVLAWRAAGREG